MSHMERKITRRPGREQRVGDILQAAFDAFAARGYENTSVAEIATKIGVVEGTIYKYFPSKRELLLKTIEYWYEDLVEQYETDIRNIEGAVKRLRFLVWRHLKIIADNPLLCRLMFREVRSEHDYIGSDLYHLNRRYTQLLGQVIRQGADEGVFRADLPLIMLRDLIYGGMEHHTWNYVCGRGELAIDAVADALTQLVCRGVLAGNTAPAHTAVHAVSTGASVCSTETAEILHPACTPLASLPNLVERLERVVERLSSASSEQQGHCIGKL